MLLKSARLKEFGPHRDLKVDFAPGMNIIRGANEQGKSNLLTGIAYCWFGTSALVDNFEDTVNWHAKNKSALRTETEFEHDDACYRCVRGSSGAELYRDDTLLVTGQKEVSQFMCQLLGLLSPAFAQRILLACQNDLRGVLSLGATAAATFVESLADFSEIDTMIKEVAVMLPNGSLKGLEDDVARLNQQLEQMEQVPPQSFEEQRAKATRLASELDALKEKLDSLYQEQAALSDKKQSYSDEGARIYSEITRWRHLLQRHQETVEHLHRTIAAKPDPHRYTAEIEQHKREVSHAETSYRSHAAKVVEARKKWDIAENSLKLLGDELYNLRKAVDDYAKKKWELEQNIKQADGLKEAQEQKLQYARENLAWNAHQQLKALPTTENWWEGDLPSLVAYENELLQTRDGLLKQSNLLQGERTAVESRRILVKTCPTCHTVLGDQAKADELNAKLDEELEGLRLRGKDLQTRITAVNIDLTEIKEIQRLQVQTQQLVAEQGLYIGIADDKRVPWVLTWRGDVPVPPTTPDVDLPHDLESRLETAKTAIVQLQGLVSPDLSRMQALQQGIEAHTRERDLLNLDGLEEQQRHWLDVLNESSKALSDVEAARDADALVLNTVEAAQRQLANMVQPITQEDFEFLQETHTDLMNRLRKLETDEGLAEALRITQQQLQAVRQDYAQACHAVDCAQTAQTRYDAIKARLVDELKEKQGQLQEQAKNNEFIKTLRDCRKLVADALWNRLMGGVSAYFSQFRGVPSVVASTPKGITVDGRLSKPSGSTLDILGLALRITIAKMFANSGLLILDEPSAGCDEDRTMLMTGGLLGAGFDQIILVTHKDVDENAGKLIFLGGQNG